MFGQAITEEIGQLQADVKDHDNLKRQLDECIAYQRNLLLEKELQAHHSKAMNPLHKICANYYGVFEDLVLACCVQNRRLLKI